MIETDGLAWRLDEAVLGPEARQAFATLESAFALTGVELAQDSLANVIRVSLDGKNYYLKRFIGSGKTRRRTWLGLRQWLGRPRVLMEWRNMLHFTHWQIPTARLVAFGLERRWGAFLHGMIITAELENTRDLAAMAEDGSLRVWGRDWWRSVSDQVADMTQKMHCHGFCHNDLKWRNILVTQEASPAVYFIDCPSGSFWPEPFLSYRIVKDLACLDKVAQHHLRRTERLRFYLKYVQKTRLTAADKQRIRKVTAFFAGRD